MKEHVIVTVSTVDGTRHFQMGKLLQQCLKGFGYFFIAAIIAGGAAIYYLNNEVDFALLKQTELQNRSLELSEEVEQLQNLKVELEGDLGAREERLQQVSDRLGDLEVVLGVAEKDGELESRLDAAAVTSSVRLYMLNNIPNGSPVGDVRVSSHYGYRIHPKTGRKTLHRGIDYAVNTGAPIYATADGVVEVVRPSKTGSGNFLRLQHSYGFSTSYSHLQKFKVKSGEFVEKGQLIAYSGNTGFSTGPHLHYEIRFVGRALDPLAFHEWSAANFETLFEKERGIRWDSLVKRIENRASNQLQLSSQKAAKSKANSS
ncbi:peptidase M23 [Vibrio breoganii]|uniref:Peptidase M23 n=1 Tax=Vibrio breoganii TaxID=553239 RepID=A0AAN1CU39_9VIBR|nr:M23 family metallopeptidase [Vibrio breoganii]ANO35225.1 peptidase M23 [Vibrio breoganii]OED86921.1 peptidase M23 [Vibrio breoganii ZF-55]OED96556.1 peptidase M23 [Vibrio breoganii ZF-29]PMG82031.1 peptidase M23 [Vibrio breoganii]PMG85567.1 peptidase M23 [Vibrio breoganii]